MTAFLVTFFSLIGISTLLRHILWSSSLAETMTFMGTVNLLFNGVQSCQHPPLRTVISLSERVKAPHTLVWGLLWWLSGKESACQCRRHIFEPQVRKIPWRRKWQLTLVLLFGKANGQRSLVGYSPQGCKESDTTERLHFHFSALLTMPKPLIVWITTNSGKFFKRWEYQST